MSKHTPGPWGLKRQNNGTDFYIADGLNWDVCQVIVSNARTPETAEANARLIAAAPQLLEALHELSLCGQNSGSSKEECGRIARAAIAKATA